MRNLRLISLVSLTLLFALPAISQPRPKPKDFGIKSRKALDYYLQGQEAAFRRMRPQAIAAYEKAIELEPDFVDARYELGVNACVQREYEDALEHLSRVWELAPKKFTQLPYFLGISEFYTERYAEAADHLKPYVDRGLGKKNNLRQASIHLRHARFAREALADSIAFRPTNLGRGINSGRNEYLPYLTADNQFLLFTSRRPDAIGGINRIDRDYSEDFYSSEWDGENWSPAKNLGPPINTEFNEGSATISEDGKTLFYTGCNREDGFGRCDIYTAEKIGDNWQAPRLLDAPINTEFWDGQPCLSPDGKTLYFASDRPGGYGSYDIWYSRWNGERWGPAINAGPQINTSGHEDSPFLHADGVSLYFSSDFHPGFGIEDLFVSYRGEDGKWSTPKNLGYPLNTVAMESNIFVSSDGRRGFINSDREGGLGGSDIYEFELAPEIRPQRATFLRGIVRDSVTKGPLAAFLRLVDVEKGDTVRQVRTDQVDGRFLMSLPLEKEYAAFVEAKGYLFASKHFFLKNLPDETYFDVEIDMVKIKAGVKVELKNIFFAFGSFELEETSTAELTFLVNYMKQNPGMRIEIQGHTDNVGGDADNQRLSQQRAEAVREYLTSQGIEGERVEATGYGESQPIASNDTEDGRQRNRRTEFKILQTQ